MVRRFLLKIINQQELRMAKILVGVTGGIAAYKIPSLVSVLVDNGHEVKVIMTESALKFITPLAFSALSKNPVICDDFTNDGHIWHIELAQWCDVMVIAPATYNTLGKIINKVADNMLTSTVAALNLSEDKKLIICPAMNNVMWYNLKSKLDIFLETNWDEKIMMVDPAVGKLACGGEGKGKLPSTKVIVDAIYNYCFDEETKIK